MGKKQMEIEILAGGAGPPPPRNGANPDGGTVCANVSGLAVER
jgi:hypothetical protein